MLRALAAGFVIFGLTVSAFAALGDAVGSFAIPGGHQAGLARSDNHLYTVNPINGLVYLVDPGTGSVYSSYPAAGGTNSRGLAYGGGGLLWLTQSFLSPFRLYATNCGNGSVLYSYPLPATSTYGAAPLSSGDGGAGTSHIILVDYNSDVVYYMTTAGSVANSHPISAKLYDIAYDWRNRLIWGSDSNCTVYGFDTSGSIVASFPGPESYGITYYGQYLWAGESAGYIYQFHCPDDISVEPASMGKIKAAYR